MKTILKIGLKMMERNGVIDLDTAYVNVQYIGLRDSVQTGETAEGNYSMEQLLMDLRMKFDDPVFIAEGSDKNEPLPKALEGEINSAKSLKACEKILREYGVDYYEHSEEKAQVIWISRKGESEGD